jgi:hypothetical protein
MLIGIPGRMYALRKTQKKIEMIVNANYPKALQTGEHKIIQTGCS